jgi:hypothetical protein
MSWEPNEYSATKKMNMELLQGTKLEHGMNVLEIFSPKTVL